jgi:hypothetical protein
MKRNFFALMMMLVALALSGCGGGDDRDLVVRDIFSDETVDGDVRRDPGGVLTVTQVSRDAVGSVLAGINPVTNQEYRAFLDFPVAGISPRARIQSATLDIVINEITLVSPTATIPIRIDLVSFAPPLLRSDFDLPPLATMTIIPPISSADRDDGIGPVNSVTIDVTDLFLEAQRRGLTNFQIRILEDSGFAFPGVIEIDDSPDPDRAPLLTVSYF